MDNNTYLIFDDDNGELIMVRTKIGQANCTHVEIVQMIMMSQSNDLEDYANITDPEEASYKVMAVFENRLSPIYEDDLNTYDFDDKTYEKLQEKLASSVEESEDDDDDDDDYDDDDYDDDEDTDNPFIDSHGGPQGA
jgi:hypothetical protein